MSGAWANPVVSSGVVALAGDWHGDAAWACARIEEVARRGVSTVLHLGDFGFWPGRSGEVFVSRVEGACSKYDVRIVVTPGNHEDWHRLMGGWAQEGAAEPYRLTEHIEILPRGFRWSMAGRSFLSLGGAPSIDFEYRTPGRDWWPEECLTLDDVERAVEGGYAEVMLTHDSPDPPYATDAVTRIIERNDGGWSATAAVYAEIGRRRVSRALLGVRPQLLAHGHHHVADQATVIAPGGPGVVPHQTSVWSVPDNGKAGNVRYLDLDSLSCAGESTATDGAVL